MASTPLRQSNILQDRSGQLRYRKSKAANPAPSSQPNAVRLHPNPLQGARLHGNRGRGSVPQQGHNGSHPTDDDEETDERENEVIMALEMKERGSIGCAYYSARDEILHFFSETKMADVEIVDACMIYPPLLSSIVVLTRFWVIEK